MQMSKGKIIHFVADLLGKKKLSKPKLVLIRHMIRKGMIKILLKFSPFLTNLSDRLDRTIIAEQTRTSTYIFSHLFLESSFVKLNRFLIGSEMVQWIIGFSSVLSFWVIPFLSPY